MPLAGHAPRNGTQVHKLTVPTNLVPFGGTERTTYAAGAAAPTTSAATGAVAPTPPTPRLPASPDELDAQVATLRDELRFTSAMPIRHWIRTADLLKRQADQHHVDGDLEAQYVCLAKCARILTDLLPNEHTAYARLDDEARDRMRRVRRPLTQNGETINHLVALTRDALNDARRTASPPPPALLPSPPPSASRAAPARPSLRTGDSPAKDAPDREGRSPALKRVSFAEGSARTASPSPVRRVLRRAFARGSEPAEGAAAPDEGARPASTGTSDSCTATSEEEVTALQLTEDLLTLGWIHTHPSQSCFLSSLDLHTQAGYQALLPEAVAVVCAPQHRPSLGVFRLTDPPGLRYILQCNASAPFHAHVVPGKDKDLPLYTDATNAHVRLDHARHAPPIRVRDLR
ncbi:hypothetical protein CBS14141_003782 [Malassezia furfur]|nr:hypothetical protein CBS14141_003782 [Malassezia furfur]